MRFLTSVLVILVACGNKSERADQEASDAQMCAEAVESGWGASQLGNPQQTCIHKMSQLHGVIMGRTVQDEIRPCIHGGTPRFCWVQSRDQSLMIWWAIDSQYMVHPDDRAKIEPYITWL